MDLKLQVTCPNCQSAGKIDLPATILEKKDTGLITINVPADLICEHAFQIFVDRNGMIRGYQAVDFSLELKKEIKETVKSALEESKKLDISIHGLMSLISTDVFVRLLKCLLMGMKITIITPNDNLVEIIKNLFGPKLPEIRNITILKQVDYDKEYSWTGLVVDLSFKMVNLDISQSKFLLGHELTHELWQVGDPVTQKILFDNFIDKIFRDYHILEEYLLHEKKQVKLFNLGKTLEKERKIRLESDRMRFLYEMLQLRNPMLAQKVDAFDTRIKSMDLF